MNKKNISCDELVMLRLDDFLRKNFSHFIPAILLTPELLENPYFKLGRELGFIRIVDEDKSKPWVTINQTGLDRIQNR